MPRYAELFAGGGGLSLGLDRAGWECAWHAEIDAFPQRILRAHWPHHPLYGDVRELDGRELVRRHGPIDLLSGGSPCQGLSMAGRREGLADARSILFYEQMRLWEETGADLCLWENVRGALSTGVTPGADFSAVLSTFVGATIPVPKDGWSSSGVAAGRTGVAAWRVLDSQWFGVPQRRARVFVVGTRTGRIDPAAVLLEPKGGRGNTPPGGRKGKRIAGGTTAGAGSAGGNDDAGTLVFDLAQITHPENRASVVPGQPSPTLNGKGQIHVAGVPFAFKPSHYTRGKDGGPEGVMPPLTADADKGDQDALVFQPMVMNETGHEKWMEERVAGSLNAHEAKEAHTLIIEPVQRTVENGAIVGPLGASDGKSQFQNIQAALSGHIVAPTLNGHQRMQVDAAMAVTAGLPRRLMPIECERLMGWPDNWTNVPDEAGKLPSDSPRYKVCGNGVVSHVVHWLALRLAAALDRP